MGLGRKTLHIIIVIFLVIRCLDTKAQAPLNFQFQGVARDGAGKILANQYATLQIQILSGAPDGPIVAQDNVNAPTNDHGVFTHVIGTKGAALNFIDWSKGPFFLRILMMDPESGQFVDIGSTQLVSVPYALHAAEATKFPDNIPITQKGQLGSGGVLAVSGAGTRNMWYPRKGAFRVGTVSGNAWDDNQIGNNSFAAGLDALASGQQSIALGNGATAKADGGIALGLFNNSQDSPDGSGSDRIFQIGNGSGNSNVSQSNAFTVLRNGNIGVGKNAMVPEYVLDIGNRIRLRSNPLLSLTAGLWLNNAANNRYAFIGGFDDDEIGFFFENKGWRFTVVDNGNANLVGTLAQNSDRRLKRDFSPLDNSLSRLSNLKGQHYFWKDTTKSQDLQTGLIAQEVEAYFPELVSTDDKGFKSVNYIGLIPHLIESVKSLKSQTDLISTMKTEMQELRAELNNIKTAAASTSNQLSK